MYIQLIFSAFEIKELGRNVEFPHLLSRERVVGKWHEYPAVDSILMNLDIRSHV